MCLYHIPHCQSSDLHLLHGQCGQKIEAKNIPVDSTALLKAMHLRCICV